ncbi:MaoC/PaaZ C-terminal domain-containing protein [Micromonospora chalcea]|uniref:MaoC/PaaZ C-terminal domain-containing protein n=1 Tax=Micromonospora sp. TSRI0369 TaxID=1703936 RepID=UPI0009F84A99|nr:MaoC/PaaZ C-terminal domain-containing protein [Micromonospora sp. TSRI0369]
MSDTTATARPRTTEVVLPVPATPPARGYGPVTRTDFVRYQGASGDMNPIHHDEVFARAAGFPSPFSVGMWQASLLGTYATDWLGGPNVRDFRIRFLAQVWPGDVLTLEGVPLRTYVLESADGREGRVDIELTCRRQTGDTAVTAWATFVLPLDAAAGDATPEAGERPETTEEQA